MVCRASGSSNGLPGSAGHTPLASGLSAAALRSLRCSVLSGRTARVRSGTTAATEGSAARWLASAAVTLAEKPLTTS